MSTIQSIFFFISMLFSIIVSTSIGTKLNLSNFYFWGSVFTSIIIGYFSSFFLMKVWDKIMFKINSLGVLLMLRYIALILNMGFLLYAITDILGSRYHSFDPIELLIISTLILNIIVLIRGKNDIFFISKILERRKIQEEIKILEMKKRLFELQQEKL
ncbi:MAG: hypothetical protein H6Q69_1319 [Firmicutes bacterium]|nr:hypothetical protein [Bacillota bacterium]